MAFRQFLLYGCLAAQKPIQGIIQLILVGVSGCQSTDLVVLAHGVSPVAQDITSTAADVHEMLVQWDDNDDGRITCADRH